MAHNWVRASIISGLDSLLKENFSVSLSALEAKINFDFTTINNSDYHVPLDTTIKLLEDCAQYTNCDYLGAMLASRQSFDTLGVLPSVGAFADSFGDALVQVLEHLSLNTQGVEWQLSTDEHFAYMTLYLKSAHNISHQQSIYLGVIQAFKLFKELSSNEWRPTRVYFTHSAPNNVKFLRSALGDNLYFNMDFNGFIFPKKMLNLATSRKNQTLNTIINDYLTLTGNSQTKNKLTQIKISIRSLLLLQQSCSLPEIASSQNQTPRAIQYYLKKHNLTYQKLLNNVRYELASELLAESEQSINEISMLVGFTDSSVFSRSFKKHIGKTPSQFRKANFYN